MWSASVELFPCIYQFKIVEAKRSINTVTRKQEITALSNIRKESIFSTYPQMKIMRGRKKTIMKIQIKYENDSNRTLPITTSNVTGINSWQIRHKMA